MLVPDCRNDESYNEDFLGTLDREFIKGFDWVPHVVDEFCLGDDDYDILSQPLPEKVTKEIGEQYHTRVDTVGEYIALKFKEYLENERDMLITSMIDEMDDEIYNAIRNKVLKDNDSSPEPKEYYDTRKEMVTGKKIRTPNPVAKWIPVTDFDNRQGFMCPECNEISPTPDDECPYCHATMKGDNA